MYAVPLVGGSTVQGLVGLIATILLPSLPIVLGNEADKCDEPADQNETNEDS